MNVLGLDISCVLEINSDISELKTPVSWAAGQIKGNHLKSAIFFNSKFRNHFSLISEVTSFVCFVTAVTKVSVCRSVCPPWKPYQIRHQTQGGPCPGVLGLLPVEPQSGLGWKGTLGMTQFQPRPCGFALWAEWWLWDAAAPRDVQELLLPLLPSVAEKHSGEMFTVLKSEGKHRGLCSVHNSKSLLW